jgi:3-deoxy-D-manno-octulosonic-acid transferase
MFQQLIYNILFIIGFLLSWPYFTWRMWRRGNISGHFWQRLGFYNHEKRKRLQKLQNPIWIHAVSVGEIMLAKVLLIEIRKLNPKQHIVLTTTTQTGRKIGETLVDDQTALLYTPTDFLYSVRRAYQQIRPKMLVLVEGEIWPNYLWCAERRNIPVCLVNARLSNRSHRRYQRFRFFVKPILEKFSWIGLQHESDLERFSQAGFPPHKLFVTGSMKFDVAETGSIQQSFVETLRKQLGWENATVFLAGSTHAGEEELLLSIYKKLKQKHPFLKFILAPRHAERASAVAFECEKSGLSFVRRTLLSELTFVPDILLLDTTGELRSLYSMAKVTFIGKSMRGKGGQNFIEAARFGCPVIVGPHMENFSNLVNMFLREQAIIQVQSDEQLEAQLFNLFSNPDLCKEIGGRALNLYQANLGSGVRTAKMIYQTWKNNMDSKY